jgi:uroporphyrinogen decarboxylase
MGIMPDYKIIKAKETMTSRERVRRTFNFEKTDRVTIGYESNALIHSRFVSALGASGKDEFLRMLGVDYIGAKPVYTGRDLFEKVPGRTVNQEFGYKTRWVTNPSGGGYDDYCDFPLKGADDETIANFPVPDPDDYDYDSLGALIAKNRDLAIYIGDPGFGDVINSTGMVMSMEDVFVNLQLEHEPTLEFIRKRTDFYLSVLERILTKYKGEIDFIWMGEDLGTQIAPIISAEKFRKIIKPVHKRFTDLAKAYDVPTLIHTCGSSSWAYEDFIEIGIKGVDTLQPEAKDMSPRYLADKFGGRLNFRGCISTAGALSYGSDDDVRNVCEETLGILMPHRGYHFAPTHCIQDNTPVENAIAMYQSAHIFGVY